MSSKFGLERAWYHRLDAKGKPYRPTIKPTPGFSASADAQRIHTAMKGAGTDEQTLINILARRNNHERQAICEAYFSQYNRTLKDDIKSDTSGEFKTVLCELIYDAPYMLAKSLYYGMKGVGTNERVLIEVLTTLWNEEMSAVAEAYKKVLADKKINDESRSLLEDVTKDTSGDFQYALQLLVEARRDTIPHLQLKAVPEKGVQTVVNAELCEADARELLAAGASRVGTNEKRISRIVCGRTTFQLAADAEAYEKLFGKSLIADMESELSGDYRTLIISLIRYANDRANLIAEWFHDALAGLGTRDYTLMRLLITRSEIDLVDIMQAYEEKYGLPLADHIRSDTSGDYQKTLLKLLEH